VPPQSRHAGSKRSAGAAHAHTPERPAGARTHAGAGHVPGWLRPCAPSRWARKPSRLPPALRASSLHAGVPRRRPKGFFTSCQGASVGRAANVASGRKEQLSSGGVWAGDEKGGSSPSVCAPAQRRRRVQGSIGRLRGWVKGGARACCAPPACLLRQRLSPLPRSSGFIAPSGSVGLGSRPPPPLRFPRALPPPGAARGRSAARRPATLPPGAAAGRASCHPGASVPRVP
jgi:hypothetical protein